ncbi:MAG: carbohydrate kinase family protein [Anaerolineales bacterium]
MVVILGDMIADFNLRIPSFPVQAGDLKRADYLGLGPGGATNVAIMAARLGLQVACLGEVGEDRFGNLVLEGLQREGIDTEGIIVSEDGETPVAGVIVDRHGEPAYLGYRGELKVDTLLPEWSEAISKAEAFFADGWEDQPHEHKVILAGLKAASEAGVPTFFDPGPGNPEYSLEWQRRAVSQTNVLMATEAEASRLTGLPDPLASAKALLDEGPDLVVMKRGVAGSLLLSRDATEIAPGLPVEARDATGAGDSLDAAVIYGWLHELNLESLGALANATGAAKVRKLGTGHNVPTKPEVQEMLDRFLPEHADILGS